jgi:hypothetical protein
MHGNLLEIPGQSRKFTCKFVRTSEQKFGRVARALWPHKTAAELAARAGVTQRAAEFWLAGREPSARAVAVILNEMLA